MKKSRRNSGFSLIELLCALLILVILVIGIGVSMDAGVGIYRDATFEASSLWKQTGSWKAVRH